MLEIGATIGEAVQEIAENMLLVAIEADEVTIGACEMPMEQGVWIELDGGIQAHFRLIATDDSALRLACALLGEEREAFDEELGDAFGEVVNMMAGGMVTRFEDREHGSVSMTPPLRVVIGDTFPEPSPEVICVHQGFHLDGTFFCAEVVFPLEFAQWKAA
ncbi:MAG: chemotaxis protein CheX [Magnetococcales bacterium]|nr:chemotaxis protein CheX [Magnetococcales bacterium]